MRKSFIALLLVLGVGAFSANLALAVSEERSGDDVGMKLLNAQMIKELASRSARLGTSTGSPFNDTTFVGYTPGPVINALGGTYSRANNYWSIYAVNGKDLGKRPINGHPDRGTWNFDDARSTNDANFAFWGASGDSLQGWVPVRNVMNGAGGLTLPDFNRPWWAVDIGNQANYVSNQANGRTHGVNGVWHVDGGDAVGVGTLPRPQWHAPVGVGAAWMGLRVHGDDSYREAKGKLNPFNEDVLQYNQITSTTNTGNDKAFPGYGSQMDQMLYRDIDYTGHSGQNLTVKFKFKTVMSKSFGTTASTRVGWFDADPLQVTEGPNFPAFANNFISSTTAGTSAPCDSFMVYIGSGVEDPNPVNYTDGHSGLVYDKKHRWFDEVLHWDRDPNSDPNNPTPLYYKELTSIAGNYPFNTANAAFTDTTYTISSALLAPYLQKNNKIRLVFRVKTNRGFDDEGTAYTSGGKGAALVDDVRITQGANPEVTLGAFDNPAEIDNDVAISAVDAWKSTGKPPGIFDHPMPLADLLYEDLCGQKGDISRQCNITGTVISAGDKDHSEAASGLIPGTADRERWNGMFSPTIQFCGPYTFGGKNVHGLYALGANGGVGDIDAGEDYYVQYDIFAGIMNPFTKGNLWRYGAMSYPAPTVLTGSLVPPGRLGPVYNAWGQVRFPGFIIFNPDPVCVPDFEPLGGQGLIKSGNTNGIPDSIKIFLGKRQECYRFGVSTGCAPVDGCYWDNICLAIIDGVPAQLQVDIWQWINDSFPFNENNAFAGNKALFDTTTALIKSGLNIAQTTGSAGPRPDVAGDSTAINSSATTARVDMVFRILPGPGNYEPIGQGHSGFLRKVPTSPAIITKGDGTFWDVYRQNPGDFATTNASVLLHNGKGGWDPNVWVSARCDTAEVNLFALGARVLGGPGDPTVWMSTYHESDAKYPLLGVPKNRCFVNDPNGVLTSPNIVCDGSIPAWAAPYYPAGGEPSGAHPLGPRQTYEFTKIIPDGLLTPGSHVEYFFRDQKDTKVPQAVPSGLIPDTNDVSPQIGEGSTDGHRWQEFAILPDRWKDNQYQHPVTQAFGLGPACLLVVDGNDRRGNERVWKGIADTIGLTPTSRQGASDGYSTSRKATNGGLPLPINPCAGCPPDPNAVETFVRPHLGQAGGPWDMFQVKASESLTTGSGSIGSRLAFVKAAPSPLHDRSSKQGPTPAMMNAYYNVMLYLSGDLNSGILGPFTNKSQDDYGLIQGFMYSGNTSTVNRGFWAIGDGFMEDLNGPGPAGPPISVDLGISFVTANFSDFSGFHGNVALLRLLPGWQGKGNAKENIQTYGIRNLCLWSNDVLTPNASAGAVLTSYYDPYVPVQGAPSGVYKPFSAGSPYISIVDGWDIEHLTNPNDNKTSNRNLWFLKIFNNVWATICSRLTGTPVTGLDEPSFDDGSLVNFVMLKNNPLSAGSASIDFGLAQADHVQLKVFDVSGRLVRTLADRQFAAGNHTIVWDGVDNSGKLVNRGVYFTQVKYATSRFQAARKLIVLK